MYITLRQNYNVLFHHVLMYFINTNKIVMFTLSKMYKFDRYDFKNNNSSNISKTQSFVRTLCTLQASGSTRSIQFHKILPRCQAPLSINCNSYMNYILLSYLRRRFILNPSLYWYFEVAEIN